jgi:hypothetical protein
MAFLGSRGNTARASRVYLALSCEQQARHRAEDCRAGNFCRVISPPWHCCCRHVEYRILDVDHEPSVAQGQKKNMLRLSRL